MAYVYIHLRDDTDAPFYVGIGSDTNGKYERAYDEAPNSRKNPHWYNIVNKVGHTVIIVMDNVSWEEACVEEKRLIKHYGRVCDGGVLVNITEGGDGVWGMKQKPELLNRLSEMNKGEGNPMWGKKHTEESREKMGVNKGRTYHISDKEKARINEVKKTNKEIKELRAQLPLNPTIEDMSVIWEKEAYLNTIKRKRMKRYERVKAKRNTQ